MELGKLLGISWWLSEKTSVSNRVSCDPKSLTVKGDLMVVNVFSVMEKAICFDFYMEVKSKHILAKGVG
jgi:hypothetical protein